jgi:hypothetical protein
MSDGVIVRGSFKRWYHDAVVVAAAHSSDTDEEDSGDEESSQGADKISETESRMATVRAVSAAAAAISAMAATTENRTASWSARVSAFRRCRRAMINAGMTTPLAHVAAVVTWMTFAIAWSRRGPSDSV